MTSNNALKAGCCPETACDQPQEEGTFKRPLKRLFERGDLQLLILLQLKTQNAHGYELMKLIGELTAGIYAPSPGVLYPTLSMLEDQIFIAKDETESRRKVFRITAEGEAFLAENMVRVTQIQDRLASIDSLHMKMDSSSVLNVAIGKFRELIRHQIRHDALSEVEMSRIVEIITRATKEIETAYQAILQKDP